MDEDAAQLRLAVREQRADELLLDVQVLVEQLGEQLLVDVAAHAHHRELEEARHGRRQGVGGPAVVLDVDEDGAAGQLVEDSACLGQVHLEDARAFSAVKGLMGSCETTRASRSLNRTSRIW